MVILDHILNPKDTLDQIKEKLFSFYVEDYGEEAKEEIRRRWKNTIFLTDSLPNEAFSFMKNNRKAIHLFQYLQAKIEFLDYDQKEKKFQKSFQEEFQEYLQGKYQIYSKPQIEELFSCPLEELSEKGYDFYLVRDVKNYRIHSLKRMRTDLIRETIWGKRMQKEYKDLTVEQIRDFIFDDEFPATTGTVIDQNGCYRTVCFIPFIRNAFTGSLDRMVFHELRHVVESSDKRSGLEEYGKNEYLLFNEVRTQDNALRDEARMPVIFGRIREGVQSIYDILLGRIPEFSSFRDFFNHVAYSGNIEKARVELEPFNQRVKEENQNIQKRLQK